jgi:hypothetical protein
LPNGSCSPLDGRSWSWAVRSTLERQEGPRSDQNVVCTYGPCAQRFRATVRLAIQMTYATFLGIATRIGKHMRQARREVSRSQCKLLKESSRVFVTDEVPFVQSEKPQAELGTPTSVSCTILLFIDAEYSVTCRLHPGSARDSYTWSIWFCEAPALQRHVHLTIGIRASRIFNTQRSDASDLSSYCSC